MLLLAFFLFPQASAESPAVDNPEHHRLLQIETREQDGTIEFFVRNLQAGPITVTLECDIRYGEADQQFPLTATYPANSHTKAFTVRSTSETFAPRWKYNYYAVFGSREAVHDNGYVYSLPFATGESFEVCQSFHGKYSHFGSNAYAIDWDMPVGTPIYAAREGRVVAARDDFVEGGPQKKFLGRANFILIEHADGTLGQYAHLCPGGVRVKVGQKVGLGEWIGLSGDTGYSSGPHLHFAVLKAKDGKDQESVPIRFRAKQGQGLVLKRGKRYVAL